MAREGAGIGAEVSAKKIDGDGDVVQKEGGAKESKKGAWITFISLCVLALFGVWKIVEIVMVLI